MSLVESTIEAVVAVLEKRADLATRVRGALGVVDANAWIALDDAATHAGNVPTRVLREAARRGELVIGHAGRTPVVQRAELDRWIASRPAEPAKVHEDPKAGARTAVERAAARWSK